MLGKKSKVRGASGRASYPAVVVLVLGIALLASASGSGVPAAGTYPPPVPLVASGLIGAHSPGTVVPVSPEEARGASYLPSSNVLRLPDGRLRFVPPGATRAETVPPDDPGAADSADESRAWLESGTVPGANGVERRIAERSLLNLRLLTRPNGAALAGSHPRWRRVWPRDASFVAVAFAATGHHRESYEILRFPRRCAGGERHLGGTLRRERKPRTRRAVGTARRRRVVFLGRLVLGR